MCEIFLPLDRQPNKAITSKLTTPHPKDVPWFHEQVDENCGHFHPPHWMVCGVSWAPTIHTGIGTPVNSSMSVWVRWMHHCTSNQARESHPYWSQNTPRMDQCGWKNTDINTSYFHLRRCVIYHALHPSIQVLTPLSIHQWVPEWGGCTIAQTTKQDDHIHTEHTICQGWTYMDERKLAHSSLFPWMMCGVAWTPLIHIGIDNPGNPEWAHVWGCYHTVQATKQGGHIHTGSTTLQGWTGINEWNMVHFLLLPWMVYDVPWAPIIHTGTDMNLNS